MFPILFHIGPLTIRTYGALVALAFLAGLEVAKRTSAIRKISETFLLDLIAILIVSGLVGARILYILLNWSYFSSHLLDSLKVWEGGLVFYGGYLFAAAVGVAFVRYRQQPLGPIADCLAPALAIGQSLGRWGCFFAGCCYGRPTPLPWAVKFKDAASLAPLGVELHPAQLYESAGCLFLGLFLWMYFLKHRKSQGEVFGLYTFLYGALRFAVEMVRGDDRGIAYGGLSPSQWVAMVAMLIAGSILLVRATTPHDAHA